MFLKKYFGSMIKGWYINCPGHANNDGKQKSKDVKMRDYVLYNTLTGIPKFSPKVTRPFFIILSTYINDI